MGTYNGNFGEMPDESVGNGITDAYTEKMHRLMDLCEEEYKFVRPRTTIVTISPDCYFDDRDLLFMEASDFNKGSARGGSPPPPITKKEQSALEEEATLAKLFEGFGVSKGRDDCPGVKLIDPVNKLKESKRYLPTAADAGSILQIRMVNQWPYPQDGRPFFELADLSQTYQEMEREMVKTYAMFSGYPVVPPRKLHKDFYGVLMEFDDDGEVILKRVKVITAPLKFEDGTPHVVEVELIDEYFFRTVAASEMILFLHEPFARLPPRVTGIEMEGMSHYMDNEFFRRFFRSNSDEFLFEGVLQAEVRPSGKVVVFNNRFPKNKFPYGINGFMAMSIIETTHEKVCSLPSLGPKPEVFVVHADGDGNIWLQLKNDISSHLLQICDSISYDKVYGMRGSVTFAELELDKGNEVIYFAPHEKSDGTQYRVVVVPSEEEEMTAEKVPVHFIDYGDDAWVTVEDLVRAADVHYLLPYFPPICVQAHLKNLWELDVPRYMAQFHNSNDRSYTAIVMKGATDDEDPAEVVLFPTTTGNGPPSCELSINEQLWKTRLADQIDPLFIYGDGGYPAVPEPMWSPIIKMYLGLGQGRRLSVGDKLQANITYNKRMGTFMFLTPCHRVRKREALETQLKRSKEGIAQTLAVPAMSRAPGTFVNCYSHVLKCHCRGVLVREKKVMFTIEGGRYPRMSTCWSTYLVDYGIVEDVPLLYMRTLIPAHADMPALGIRVTNCNLATENNLRLWWAKTWANWWCMFGDVETTVVVTSISHDENGEYADVDFPELELTIEEEPTVVRPPGQFYKAATKGSRKRRQRIPKAKE